MSENFNKKSEEQNKLNDVDEMNIEEMKATAQLIKESTWAGQFLCDKGYEIFDLNQANDDFRKLMGLDNITEINGVYSTEINGRTESKIVSITKSNFYNAFYEPIWENITDAEKIKALEWMFEEINEKYHFGIKEISYFTKFDSVDDYRVQLGAYNKAGNTLYLSLNRLNHPFSPYLICETLAHELTHARQNQFAKQMDKSKKYTFAEVSQSDLGHFDNTDLGLELRLDEAISYALYKVSQSEKSAELNGLKYVKKYIDLNEKTFGKNEEVTDKYEKFKHMILTYGTSKYTDSFQKDHYTVTTGILTNEKVILKGQSETLLKLIMLRNFYEIKIAECYSQKEELKKQILSIRKDFIRDKVTQNDWAEKTNKLQQKLENVACEIKKAKKDVHDIKAIFMETLEKGKLPDSFDIKNFDVLNILEEPKSEYSLPEWLREDEIEFNKQLDKELNCKDKNAQKDNKIIKIEEIREEN